MRNISTNLQQTYCNEIIQGQRDDKNYFVRTRDGNYGNFFETRVSIISDILIDVVFYKYGSTTNAMSNVYYGNSFYPIVSQEFSKNKYILYSDCEKLYLLWGDDNSKYIYRSEINYPSDFDLKKFFVFSLDKEFAQNFIVQYNEITKMWEIRRFDKGQGIIGEIIDKKESEINFYEYVGDTQKTFDDVITFNYSDFIDFGTDIYYTFMEDFNDYDDLF